MFGKISSGGALGCMSACELVLVRIESRNLFTKITEHNGESDKVIILMW